VLERLTTVEPDAAGGIPEDLRLLEKERGGTALVVVTGALQGDEVSSVAPLRDKFQKLVVVSLTPGNQIAPECPGVTIICATSADSFCQGWNVTVGR
jgi:hypothetical protein